VAHLREVQIAVLPIDRFESVLGREQMHAALAVADEMRERLAGRVVWNVNSTDVGGGVAEMLRPLLGYSRSVGVDARWVVINGNPDFFHITKRVHHALHGSEGDGSKLGVAARQVYERTLRDNAIELGALVRPGDIVLLHDPQTAGLADHLIRGGAHVVWRCHVGCDSPNEEVERGWDFLYPYTRDVPAFIFSRDAYIPEYCDHGKSTVIQPSIDAFSAKNEELTEAAVRTILVHVGLVEGPAPDPSDHGFLREHGSPGRVTHRADVVRLGRAPSWDTPLVVQVSRWDPLKDMIGVMHGFARLHNGSAPGGAHLVLAGPNVKAVADDPEGAQVFAEVVEAWRELPHAIRDHIHVASLPTADVEENAAIVNALQRHAAVVVQKSLHEGFGLTVTEAMWKARPVVASAVGGIQDQIEDGLSGILLKEPTNLDAFAEALRGLLENPAAAARLGAAAKQRVREHFLGVRHLIQYAELFQRFLG
jgi:trehalose synthase